MNNPLKGFSKIFSFTFRQHVKSRGYKNSTIVIALLCLLLPALVMVAGLIAVACFENTLGPKR